MKHSCREARPTGHFCYLVPRSQVEARLRMTGGPDLRSPGLGALSADAGCIVAIPSTAGIRHREIFDMEGSIGGLGP